MLLSNCRGSVQHCQCQRIKCLVVAEQVTGAPVCHNRRMPRPGFHHQNAWQADKQHTCTANSTCIYLQLAHSWCSPGTVTNMLTTQCALLSTSLAATSQHCLQQLHRCFLSPQKPSAQRFLAHRTQAPRAAAAAGPLEQQQQQMQQQQRTQPQLLQQQQQPQHAGPVQQLDSSVQETLKLLEAGLGPLSTQPMVPPSAARVFVISGPSGVGKDAVLKHLQQRRPDLHFVVTATSRGMRPGEVEGKDYFFVSKEQFEEWIAGGQLLEHALVYGEYKGIPRGQVDAALQRGADVVLRIDVQGAATVRKLLPGVVSVFLVAESEAQLVARLVSRKTEQMDKMMTRVQTARDECRQLSDFDYVVVNKEGQLEECVDKLCAIIDAERLKTQKS